MVTNSGPSHSGAGISCGGSGGGGDHHIFKTKNMSYYSSSTSENLTPENSRIFAFANRGEPLYRMVTSRYEDFDDQHVTEDVTILNHLKKLVKEGGEQKKKRKTKEKEVDEFEGLYVIDVNERKIDLKSVANSGDEVFESVLKEMTDGMATEYQHLGVLYSLDGTWGSDRKRTKYVDAAVFAKVLPAKWRILLSLRPRASQPSLYCQGFVSPSGVHLQSCKEAAFYLKSQLLTTHTSPPQELPMIQIENCRHVDVQSGALVLRSSSPDSKFHLFNINGKKISLKLLENNGDREFQSVLNTMTDGMVKEDQLLEVMNTLDGTWGSKRKRRKYVDAAALAKILPVNWKILLSLRPRARQPSLYCWRFVSPSGVHLTSCKEVAFYLKSQIVTTDTSTPEEVAMMQRSDTDFHVDVEPGSLVPISSPPAIEVEYLETGDLRNVPLYHLIECQYCKSPFTSMDELESHIQNVHGNTVRRSNKDTFTGKLTSPRGLLLLREPKYLPPSKEKSVVQKTVLNKELDRLEDTARNLGELKGFPLSGEGSSSIPKPLNDPQNRPEEGKLKTRCTWCLDAFFLEHVDAKTLASSSGFICPKCKEDAAWRFDKALSELNQDVGK